MINVRFHKKGTVFKGGHLQGKMAKNIDHAMSTGVQRMARETHDLAPVLHYVLAPSIANSPSRLGQHHYIYGSELPYSRRWEYEHHTKSGYFRKSVGKYAPELADEIAKAIIKGVDESAEFV